MARGRASRRRRRPRATLRTASARATRREDDTARAGAAGAGPRDRVEGCAPSARRRSSAGWPGQDDGSITGAARRPHRESFERVGAVVRRPAHGQRPATARARAIASAWPRSMRAGQRERRGRRPATSASAGSGEQRSTSRGVARAAMRCAAVERIVRAAKRASYHGDSGGTLHPFASASRARRTPSEHSYDREDRRTGRWISDPRRHEPVVALVAPWDNRPTHDVVEMGLRAVGT